MTALDAFNAFGPWGILVVGAGVLWRAHSALMDRHVALVEKTASALDAVAKELPEIRKAIERQS